MNTLNSSMTLLQARMEVGRANQQADATEQIRQVNLIRQWLYANQRPLSLDLSLCFCAPIQCFCDPSPTCSDTYKGVRMPSHFQSTEMVRLNNNHVPVFSPFRLPYDGVSGFPNDTDAKLFDNGYAPLERDFDCCQPTALRFVSEKCGTNAQTMVVTGITYEDREETYDYTVTRDAAISNEVFKRITKVHFPAGVVGRVILSQPDGGQELARYEHGQVVPQYREYKLIGGGCDATQLVIRANLTYQDVTDDMDLVEHGLPLAWQLMAKYMELLNRADKTPNDRENQKNYLATVTDLLRENAAVEQGEDMNFTFRRKSLTGGRLSNEYYGSSRR